MGVWMCVYILLKIMKDELRRIRPILDRMGPIPKVDKLQLIREKSHDEVSATTADDQAGTTAKPSGIPVYHVNTNRFPQVGARNHIHGLPTLVLFWEGRELWRVEGVMRGEVILREIERELSSLGLDGPYSDERMKKRVEDLERLNSNHLEELSADIGNAEDGRTHDIEDDCCEDDVEEFVAENDVTGKHTKEECGIKENDNMGVQNLMADKDKMKNGNHNPKTLKINEQKEESNNGGGLKTKGRRLGGKLGE